MSPETIIAIVLLIVSIAVFAILITNRKPKTTVTTESKPITSRPSAPKKQTGTPPTYRANGLVPHPVDGIDFDDEFEDDLIEALLDADDDDTEYCDVPETKPDYQYTPPEPTYTPSESSYSSSSSSSSYSSSSDSSDSGGGCDD